MIPCRGAVGLRVPALALAAWCAAPGAAAAQETAPSANERFTLRTSFKGSLLVAGAVPSSPDGAVVTSFWRVRLEPKLRLGAQVRFEGAYEQRALVASDVSDAAAGVLPAAARAPYRIRQLDWTIASSDRGAWRQEIDRAAVNVDTRRARLTVGRQAIGWGRGTLFSAVDLFSPFTPFEADREWRRGVDAARMDLTLTDRSSLDVVSAFGTSLDASAFVARWRGFSERADVEIIGGYRATDAMAAATSSAPVGPIEVHGELAWFRAQEPLPGRVTGRTAVKGVVGGSYRVPVGAGILVFGEYHYSGFGAAEGQLPALLQDSQFQERYFRGDTQILGRRAMAIVGTYEASPEIALSGQWLHSPGDGSSAAVPSTTITLGDRFSVLLNVYLPYGGTPKDSRVTELGIIARALFVQFRLYV